MYCRRISFRCDYVSNAKLETSRYIIFISTVSVNNTIIKYNAYQQQCNTNDTVRTTYEIEQKANFDKHISVISDFMKINLQEMLLDLDKFVGSEVDTFLPYFYY